MMKLDVFYLFIEFINFDKNRVTKKNHKNQIKSNKKKK